MYSLPLILWLLIISACSVSLISKQHSLGGQHLRVIWTGWSGNPKGLSGPLKGGVLLNYLSNRLNFTYEMVRVTENRLEPPTNGRGLFSYLFDQVEYRFRYSYLFFLFNIMTAEQCDLIIQDVIPTVQRNEIVDLTTYWIYGDLNFLIPVTGEQANINGVVRPFQWPVWLGLCVSIACVMGALNLMNRYTEKFLTKWKNCSQSEKGIEFSRNSNLSVVREQGQNEYLYVFGTIMSQGIFFRSKRLSFRLVAGVWALTAIIFVQAYTSILFTYIVSPVNHPLMNSVYDISEHSDINVFIKMAGITDTLLSAINNTNLYTKLRNKIDSSPDSRCNLTSECIRLVTPGSRNVVIDVKNYIKDAIKGNYERTRKCNLQMAKEGFMQSYATLALQKNSPHTKIISLGVLDLHQTGLLDHWDTWFRPMPPQCTGNIQSESRKSRKKNSSLSFKNLMSTFIVLLTGLSVSFLAFLFELIFSLPKKTNARRERQI